jgi:glycosyltransferase involved in cell wall biosynthesis
MDFMSRLRRRIRREQISRSKAHYRNSRPEGCEVFSDDRSEYGDSLITHLPKYDVINLHWVAGFLDAQYFFSAISEQKRVVWTLHDMNAFTGGCHYDQGCGKYNDRCGACPQLGSDNKRDLSNQIWERKHAVFSRTPPESVHIVALNQWMAEKVKNSTLLQKFPITVIPNGLDVELFSPRDRYVARKALEVPNEAKVVLFVSDSLSNNRKGFGILVQALEALGDVKNIFLISLGRGKPAVEPSTPLLNLGHIENDRLLSLAYSAADVFVIPSLQDNLPNTVVESLSCGTPVVGFSVGGIPEMVRPGITGCLAPPEDVDSLRAGIVRLLNDTTKQKNMRANCRRIAVEEYSFEVQAGRYVNLYEQILDESSRCLQ